MTIGAGTFLAGSLISSIVGGGLNWFGRKRAREEALKDRDDERSYNSPLAQISRLQQAGLSGSALYGGAAAGASAMPNQVAPAKTDIDESIMSGIALSLAKTQQQLLAEDLTSKRLDNMLKSEEVRAELEELDFPDEINAGQFKPPTSRLAWRKRVQLAAENADNYVKESKMMIETADRDLYLKLFHSGKLEQKEVEQINNIILRNKAIREVLDTQKKEEEFKDRIRKLASKGEFTWETLGSLFYLLLTKNASLQGFSPLFSN